MSEPLNFSDPSKLRTRGGEEVRIYATDGAEPYPIQGAILRDGEWKPKAWMRSGVYDRHANGEVRTDLVPYVPEPPKPRTREVWVNVYETNPDCFVGCINLSKELADRSANHSDKRIACQRIVLTEGQFDSEPSVPGPKRYTFEETGDVRRVSQGDFFVSGDEAQCWMHDGESVSKYPILRRIEPSRA